MTANPEQPVDDNPVGRRIRTQRLAQGVSQRELAKRAGIDIKTLNSIEKGNRSPADTSLSKVEAALKRGPETQPPRRALSARDLSDEELAAEVTYRLLRGSR